MAGDILQAVRDPFGTPSVLFDFNNENPLAVEAWSSPMPLGKERTIKLSTELITTTQDLAAATMQNLARLLNQREGWWLKHQAIGATHATYFRVLQMGMDEIDEQIAAKAYRKIQLSLPAERYAIGAPETNTATVTNDPTTGTNKLQFVMPTVKGDAAAPLYLSIPQIAGIFKTAYASYSSLDGTTFTAPHYQSLTSPTKKADGGGWTIADSAEATNVSGNKRRLTGSGFIVPTANVVIPWANIKPGNYRAYVRTAGIDAGTELLFFNRPPVDGVAFTREEAAASKVVSVANTGHDWTDLGVVAMPGGAPLRDTAYGLNNAAASALFNVGVYSSLATVVDLDAVVLVPAGRPDVRTHHGSIELPLGYTSRTAHVDGVTRRRYGSGQSSVSGASGNTPDFAAASLSGGVPFVVPGADNVITVFATANNDAAGRVDDLKSTTTVVTWKYFPPYAYDRPATT
jgi:hypothetical protein